MILSGSFSSRDGWQTSCNLQPKGVFVVQPLTGLQKRGLTNKNSSSQFYFLQKIKMFNHQVS